MQKGRVHSDAKADVWIWRDLRYLKSNDIIKFLLRHSFFNNVNFNKSWRQFLHLNALYPLAFVLLKTDGTCLSFRSFCFQVTWLTKYGHDYQNWLHRPIEETWSKTNSRILKELKIWWLEVFPSNHFELFCNKGLPPWELSCDSWGKLRWEFSDGIRMKNYVMAKNISMSIKLLYVKWIC